MANKILKYVKRPAIRPGAQLGFSPRTAVSMHLPGRTPTQVPLAPPARPRFEHEI